MATTEQIVQQLIGSILQNPQSAQTIVEHPYSSVKKVTGQDWVEQSQVAEVISMLGGLAKGKTVDYGLVQERSQSQLAKSGGSAHSMAENVLGSLFGFGQAAQQQQAAAAQNSGIDMMDILGNLAGVAFSSGKAGAKVDLSDGIGIGDILGIANLAGGLFGK
ncbi:MAG: hypothetical protein E7003_05560 [Eggerthellaceae bacterium]|nr:hypothetical protein [Eggerthellaceae bacterium]